MLWSFSSLQSAIRPQPNAPSCGWAADLRALGWGSSLSFSSSVSPRSSNSASVTTTTTTTTSSAASPSSKSEARSSPILRGPRRPNSRRSRTQTGSQVYQPLHQQNGQESLQKQQHSSNGADAASVQPAVVYVHPALQVEATAVLHTSQHIGAEYCVAKFKEVLSCSNGTCKPAGWQPADKAAAAAALDIKAASKTSYSAASRNSQLTRQPVYVMRHAAKLLHVVGNLGNVRCGLTYKICGQWTQHPQYGWQIKSISCQEVAGEGDPVSYLSSFEGVGSATAKRVLNHFGHDIDVVRSILSQPEPEALAELRTIPGIGIHLAKKIKHAFDRDKGEGNHQQLEQKLSLEGQLLPRVLQRFTSSEDAVSALSSNPYTLFRVVPGYTLSQADRTAASLGFDPAAPERGAAYLLSTLLQGLNQSKIHLPWASLEQDTLQLLQKADWPGWGTQGLRASAEQLVQAGHIVVEECHALEAGADHQLHSNKKHPSHMPKHKRLYKFPLMQSGWQEDAQVYLVELHQAEQDTIEFLLQASSYCCKVLQQQQVNQHHQLDGHAHQRRTRHDHSTVQHTDGSSSGSGGSSLQLPISMPDSVDQRIQQLERQLSRQMKDAVELNEGQRVALLLADMLPFMVLTGAPGCGKTLISQAVALWLLDNYRSPDLNMAAPTGRAAQRLQELLTVADKHAARVSTSTIHRLLGYCNSTVHKRLSGAASDMRPEAQGPDLDLSSKCEFNKLNRLPEGNYLVDEMSMMDMPLAAALFTALGTWQRRLLLVGDPDQLPPVGPGQPVADAVAEGVLPCVDLRQIYRTAANSNIVSCAHAINTGVPPAFSAVWDIKPGRITSDIRQHVSTAAAHTNGLVLDGRVLFLRLPDTCGDADVKAAMQQTAEQLLPLLGCDMKLDVQVLSPVKGSQIGTEKLNFTLQQHFNPAEPGKQELMTRRSFKLRVGDKVTHLKNDTLLDVYNGDQGFVESVDPQQQSVTIRYPSRRVQFTTSSATGTQTKEGSYATSTGAFHMVTYQGSDIDNMLQLAWATTVHKAQGGEFPVVLLALHKVAGQSLKRQLLYTAVSRARQLLVIVGTDAAIAKCLHTSSQSAPVSRFRDKLRSARVERGLPTIKKAVFGPSGWTT